MIASSIGHPKIDLRSWRGPAAVTLVAAGALIFDVLTPQVVSVTVGYVGLVLIGYWLPDPRAALALALLATPLIIVGHWISIPESTPEWQSWMNRGSSVGSVWLTAVFVWRIRVLEQKRRCRPTRNCSFATNGEEWTLGTWSALNFRISSI
jgi:hypothetical protein